MCCKNKKCLYTTHHNNIVNISQCRYIRLIKTTRDHCGRDRMVVGFITTYAISAYHH